MVRQDNSVEVAWCLFTTVVLFLIGEVWLGGGWYAANWIAISVCLLVAVIFSWIEYKYRKMWKETNDKRLEEFIKAEEETK